MGTNHEDNVLIWAKVSQNMIGFDSIDLNEALEKLDFVSTKTFVITRSKSNI